MTGGRIQIIPFVAVQKITELEFSVSRHPCCLPTESLLFLQAVRRVEDLTMDKEVVHGYTLTKDRWSLTKKQWPRAALDELQCKLSRRDPWWEISR